MNAESKKFLYKLLETPSPSGFEGRIQKIVKTRMQDYADQIRMDLHGNLIVGLNTKAPRSVMLAGHCDQIGFMVKHISELGYIYVESVGGIDKGVLPGSIVEIHAESGTITGVFGRKPIHSQNAEDRQRMLLDITRNWIDIGAKDRKEAERFVKIGDYVTFKPGVTELRNDLISAPGIDNRVGLFVVMEALRLCAKAKLNVALYAVSTVQEEIGRRGAYTATYSLNPEVGIAVDVTHASDNPGCEDPRATPILLGKGPVISRGPNTNPVVEKRLTDAAKAQRTAYQVGPDPTPFGNDANSMQVTRGGVATASVQIPQRYMHTQVEVCHLKDLENAARVIAQFIKDIKPSTDFRPF